MRSSFFKQNVADYLRDLSQEIKDFSFDKLLKFNQGL